MTDNTQNRRLPEKSSIEFLRKEAKRLAKAQGVKLSAAQAELAVSYGFAGWAKLVAHVEAQTSPVRVDDAPGPELGRAARRGDVAEVKRLIAAGADVEAGDFSPLWQACAGDGLAGDRIAIVKALLDAGAQVRRGQANGAPAICAAAAKGPWALVELLIRRGAKTWQSDNQGRDALAYARAGSAPDRETIVRLLHRPVIDDPMFAAAVKAVQTGDVKGLEALLDRHPELLRVRAKEPDCYDQDYFRDPKLFWFVANNPILTETMPRNMVAVAQAMISRGVEQADLDYTLALVATGAAPRRARLQGALIRVLVKAGAKPGSMLGVLGHRERGAAKAVLAAGAPLTALIAAGMGMERELALLLPSASEKEVLDAFSVAVINEEVGCAKLCLDAGAPVSSLLTAHAHSTAAHQAAVNDDVAMLKLLVERGADLSIKDTMWNGTPLGWARHEQKKQALAFLEEVLRGRS